MVRPEFIYGDGLTNNLNAATYNLSPTDFAAAAQDLVLRTEPITLVSRCKQMST